MRFDRLFRDTRDAARRLLRDWRFTSAAVLILALAIGANTAIFSVVNAALLRPHKFQDPARLVDMYENARDGSGPELTSYPVFRDMAEYRDIFANITAISIPVPAKYRDEGSVRSAVVEYTTSTYPSVLGLRPRLGRWFNAEEEARGADVVGIVGHQTWTSKFGSDPSVIGRVIRINGVPVTIIGVGPVGSQRHGQRRHRYRFLASGFIRRGSWDASASSRNTRRRVSLHQGTIEGTQPP
jgi:hypothetical protein